MNTESQLSEWFTVANKLEAMFEDWRNQDDEYTSALVQLEPEDRDPLQEQTDRERINRAREKAIRDMIMEIPSVHQMLEALKQAYIAL